MGEKFGQWGRHWRLARRHGGWSGGAGGRAATGGVGLGAKAAKGGYTGAEGDPRRRCGVGAASGGAGRAKLGRVVLGRRREELGWAGVGEAGRA